MSGDRIRSNSTKKLGALCLVLFLVISTLGLMVGHTAGTQNNELFQDSGELGVYERYPEDESVGIELNETMGADLNVSVRDDIGNNVNITFYANMSGENLEEIYNKSNLAEGDWANYTWEGLEYGTEYEWYVNVTEYEKEEVNYTESEIWTFTTEHNPNMPELERPEDGSVISIYPGMNTTLEVNVTHPEGQAMNVTFYDGDGVEIDNVTNVGDGLQNVTWENLEYGTQYTWYVNVTESGNEYVNYTESAMWSFTTEHIPNMPELVVPGDGAEVSIYPGMNTTLEVNVTHPEGKPMNVTFYDGDGVEIANLTNVGDGVHNVTWEDLEGGTEYTWYVNVTESGDEDVNYTESAIWSFTTKEVITGILPADGAGDVELGENRNTTLRVNVTHPTGYDTNVTFYANMSGENLDFLGKDTNIPSGDWANYSWEGLDYHTEYTWYVKIANATTGELITESSIWTFTTQQENYSLTIDSTEGGEVVDPGEGSFNYVNGTTVELEAVSNEGYHFVEWTGDNGTIDDTAANSTTIEMLDNYDVMAEFAEDEQENFKVDIIDNDDEVKPGEYLMVKFTVENTGDVKGTQNISFTVDGSEDDGKEVTLDPGENDTLKFFWEAEAGSYLLTVASDDDEDTVAVTVEAETAAFPGIPGFTSLLLVLATLFAVVIYHKKQR